MVFFWQKCGNTFKYIGFFKANNYLTVNLGCQEIWLLLVWQVSMLPQKFFQQQKLFSEVHTKKPLV